MPYSSRRRRPLTVLRHTSFRPEAVVPRGHTSAPDDPLSLLLPRRRLISLSAPQEVHRRGLSPFQPAPACVQATALTIVLPVPPSINHQYATVNGRRLLSAEGRAYKALVGQHIMTALAGHADRARLLTGFQTAELALTIRFFFTSRLRRDVDGGLKIAQDALCQGLGINDNRIVETHLYKDVDKVAPRMEIRLCMISPR